MIVFLFFFWCGDDFLFSPTPCFLTFMKIVLKQFLGIPVLSILLIFLPGCPVYFVVDIPA